MRAPRTFVSARQAFAPRLCSHLLLTPRADKDKSGSVSLEEFINAMEGFGMQVQGVRPGAGGLPLATVKALFNSYDADHSGSLSAEEVTHWPRRAPLRQRDECISCETSFAFAILHAICGM